MLRRGLEPPQACAHNDLNVARIPIPPSQLLIDFITYLGVNPFV